MASPNFDALSVQHSKNINDPVAAAATNGFRWTSAQRTYHLNEAIRRILKLYARVARMKMEAGVPASREMDFLDAYMAVEAQSLSNNTKALSSWTGGVMEILSAYNATDSLPVSRLKDTLYSHVQTGGNGFLTASTTRQYWLRDGSSFRLVDGGTTTGDSISLRYIKPHTDLSAGGASDILVTSPYWGLVLDMAMKVALEENADPQSAQTAQQKEAIVNAEINAQ